MNSKAKKNNIVKEILLACLVTSLVDFSLAQLAKVFWDLWDVSKIERKYRIRSSVYHHDLKPNVDTIGVFGTRRCRMKTNSLGFKDKTVRQVPLRSGRRRILFLGDSFTEGNGVEFEDTFVGILSDKFSKKGIEVLNAAVSSYSPSIYFRKTKYLIEDIGLDFDEVIVFIDLSDINDDAYFYDFDEDGNVITVWAYLPALIDIDRETTWAEHFEATLKNNSVLARTIYMIKHRFFDPEPPWGVCRRTGDEAILKNHKRSMWTINDTIFREYAEKGLEKARRNMDKLVDLLQRHKKRLTIAVYPWPDQILHHDLNSKQVIFWKSWAEKNGIEFLNFFPYFITDENAKDVIKKYYLPCDMHWSGEGHRFVAEAVSKEYGKSLKINSVVGL